MFVSFERLSTFVTTLVSLEQSSTGVAALRGTALAGPGCFLEQGQNKGAENRDLPCESRNGSLEDRPHPMEGEDDDARVILGLMTMEEVREERRQRRRLEGDKLSLSQVVFPRAGTG